MSGKEEYTRKDTLPPISEGYKLSQSPELEMLEKQQILRKKKNKKKYEKKYEDYIDLNEKVNNIVAPPVEKELNKNPPFLRKALSKKPEIETNTTLPLTKKEQLDPQEDTNKRTHNTAQTGPIKGPDISLVSGRSLVSSNSVSSIKPVHEKQSKSKILKHSRSVNYLPDTKLVDDSRYKASKPTKNGWTPEQLNDQTAKPDAPPNTYKFQLELPKIQVDGTTYNAKMYNTDSPATDGEQFSEIDDDTIQIKLTPETTNIGDDDSKTSDPPVKEMTLNLSVMEVIPTKYPTHVYKFHNPKPTKSAEHKPSVKIDNDSKKIFFEYTKFKIPLQEYRENIINTPRGGGSSGGRSRTHKLHTFKRRKTSRNKTRRMRRSAFLHKTKKNFHRR
jgi:hypothetical protein